MTRMRASRNASRMPRATSLSLGLSCAEHRQRCHDTRAHFREPATPPPPTRCGVIDRVALHLVPAADAGSALLRAAAQDPGIVHLACFGADDAQFDAAQTTLRQHGYRGKVDVLARARPQDLDRFGTLYHPGRRASSAWPGAASASASAATACAASRTRTRQPCRDDGPRRACWWRRCAAGTRVICTSRVVRDSVRRVLERQADYLGARLGAPALRAAAAAADPARRALRATSHADADAPRRGARAARHRRRRRRLPVLRPPVLPRQGASAADVQRARAGRRRTARACTCCCAAGSTGRRGRAGLPRGGRAAVPIGAPDGARRPRSRDRPAPGPPPTSSLALRDNVQERFGLRRWRRWRPACRAWSATGTATATLVRDGVDGYRIPTVMPGPGAGLDLAQRYDDGVDSYDHVLRSY